ncbi:DUF2478 domain-containing protein [Rhodocista pekingensis]|uniref:DUF2478 domain-containing protein n=1 Tax=Rhodocista pekingensis TaxID=201185 RepID=A0ABW2KQA4_9PROT
MAVTELDDTDFFNPWALAAIVYDSGVNVDLLMGQFAAELSAAGERIGGVVQLPPGPEGCGPRALMQVLDVGSNEVIRICQDLGPGASSCRLDPARLLAASLRVRMATLAAPDLVFVSRFGKQEASGGGLRDEIARAAMAGVPVLTAVKRSTVEAWMAFSGGRGTLLYPRLSVLHDWWQDGRRRRRLPPLAAMGREPWQGLNA